MNELKKFFLVYFATPYSLYPFGPEMAFRKAAELTARLAKERIKIFSPIAHTHPIAMHGKIDPFDHKFWLDFDRPFMELADALLVAKMEGWEQSFGVAAELTYFRASQKPIFYLNITSMELEDETAD